MPSSNPSSHRRARNASVIRTYAPDPARMTEALVTVLAWTPKNANVVGTAATEIAE
ncbi:MAG: hypothetical protein AB7R89_30955 [Dehalococcoidia bacterium]